MHYPGAISHFIVRGNNRQGIFRDARDRDFFERLLKDGVERFGHRIHASCWMTNHLHMAVQVFDVPLSKVAHNLLSRYAKWFNRRHGRTGHLFERRYRSYPVPTDAALQSLTRYIHLNPVRVGIVESPADYRWSSYAWYLGRRKPAPAWLTTDFLLSLFAEIRARAIRALQCFTESDSEDCGWREGENSFAAGYLEELPQLDLEGHEEVDLGRTAAVTIEEILDLVCSSSGLSRADLPLNTQRRPIVRARSVAAWLVSRTPHLTLRELARELQRDRSTLSRAAITLAGKLAIDPEIEVICRELEEALRLRRQ